MPQLVLKKRHRLRRKVIKTVLAQIWETNGLLPPWLEEDMDGAKGPTGMVYILGGDIVAMEVDGKATLALRGLLRHLPPKGFVTIDMGAVKFIYNGADVMSPGIVDADTDILPGGAVWVRDEKNLRPLSITPGFSTPYAMMAACPEQTTYSVFSSGDSRMPLGFGRPVTIRVTAPFAVT